MFCKSASCSNNDMYVELIDGANSKLIIKASFSFSMLIIEIVKLSTVRVSLRRSRCSFSNLVLRGGLQTQIGQLSASCWNPSSQNKAHMMSAHLGASVLVES